MQDEARLLQDVEANHGLLGLLNGLEALVFVVDPTSRRILFVNGYGRERFGEQVGEHCWRGLLGRETPCPSCEQEGGSAARTAELHGGIDDRWYEFHHQMIPWPDGRMVRLEIGLDITRRKVLEEAQRRLLVENRLLTRRQFTIHEEERRTLARDLHDDLGQLLVAINTQARLIRELCRREEAALAETVDAKAERIERLVEETDLAVHDLVDTLRPSLVEELGLEEALRNLVLTWRARHAASTCKLILTELPAALDPDLAVTVYRVVQEGLTNAAKHAGAGETEVRLLVERLPKPPHRVLESTRGYLHVTVRDDGMGLAEGSAPGTGILGLRERVAALGGRLELAPHDDGGTRLSVVLPLEAAYGCGCISP